MLPAALAQALLERLDNAGRSHATPGHLAATLDPRTVQTPALDLIDSALVDLANTPDGRLVISLPPQEGKSTRAMDFVIWQLLDNPETRVATASYAQGLANRNGRRLRNTIIAHPELGLSIASDNGAVSEWTLAGHEGGVLSVGRGAGITGRPVDCLVIDDPLKDRTEADSQLVRDNCWDWWTDSLSTRLAPGAPVLLILTRWHDDDLAGRLTSAPDGHLWRVVNIPAQAEANDPLDRDPGEYLISARGHRDWEAIKTRVGSRTWNALYQGRPSPAEGGMFQRSWWRRYTIPPERGTLLQSWDLAFKDAKTSDYVVGQVWMHDGANAYLLDQVRGRWGFTETVQQIEAMSARWPAAHLKLIEDKANGPAVIDSLRGRLAGIVPVNPQGGKEARASAVSPFIEAGNVLLPERPFAAELIEECAAFPTATHDDQVDAMTQALARIFITSAGTGATRNVYRLG